MISDGAVTAGGGDGATEVEAAAVTVCLRVMTIVVVASVDGSAVGVLEGNEMGMMSSGCSWADFVEVAKDVGEAWL
jgi:hypothetical protein